MLCCKEIRTQAAEPLLLWCSLKLSMRVQLELRTTLMIEPQQNTNIPLSFCLKQVFPTDVVPVLPRIGTQPPTRFLFRARRQVKGGGSQCDEFCRQRQKCRRETEISGDQGRRAGIVGPLAWAEILGLPIDLAGSFLPRW